MEEGENPCERYVRRTYELACDAYQELFGMVFRGRKSGTSGLEYDRLMARLDNAILTIKEAPFEGCEKYKKALKGYKKTINIYIRYNEYRNVTDFLFYKANKLFVKQ